LELTAELLERICAVPGQRLLDIGCGGGAACACAAQAGFEVTGLDIEAEIVDAASLAYPDIDFCVGKAEELPFDRDSFDAVLLECVLSLTDAERALAEVMRVLKDDGHIAVSDLYLRRGDGELMNREEILAAFDKAGFRNIEFYDRTSLLKRLLAESIMDGTRDSLACLTPRCADNAKMGYYILTAGKRAVPISPIERITRKKSGLGDELDREKLFRWQLARLSETIEFARTHSRFYEERLGKAELPLDAAGLLAVPFTSADDIRDHGEQMLCLPQSEISRAVTLHTSGSKGRPKRLFFTDEDLLSTMEFFSRGMEGVVRPGGHVAVFMPGETPSGVGALIRTALTEYGMPTECPGPISDYSAAADYIRTVKPDCVIGFPSQIRALAYEIPEFRPESVMLCADFIPKTAVTAIERIWKCRVFRHYGSTEMGLAGGVDCVYRRGYHMRDADILYEIIDPHTGRPVRDGETGEIVFSTLSRRGMPLIRYRTGDIAAFLTERCACGAVMPMLGPVVGRISDAVELPDGSELTIHVLDELLFALPEVLDYTAEYRPGPDAELRLHVKWAAQAAPERVREAVTETLGGIRVSIREGEGFFTRGTVKRALIVDRNMY